MDNNFTVAECGFCFCLRTYEPDSQCPQCGSKEVALPMDETEEDLWCNCDNPDDPNEGSMDPNLKYSDCRKCGKTIEY